MESDVEIREATIDDVPALNALWLEGDQFHHEGAPQDFDRPADPARPLEFVKSNLADLNQALLVAIAQDTVIGLVRATLRDRRSPFIPRRFAVVEDVVVASARRGEGIGRRLMAEAEAWATNNGAEELWLDVWEFNEGAIAFYASLGYESVTLRMRKRVDL